MKKIIALFLVCVLLLPSRLTICAKDYDEIGAYNECCTLYPNFVQKVKDNGVTDSQIITFLGSVEAHLSTREEELSEENFDEYMFDAIQYAFNLRKNIKVRNALAKAYPDSIADAVDGIISHEFMPIYDTVRRFLFGITTPVITISLNHINDETVVYAHSAHLPEDCIFLLAVYDKEGSLLKAKRVTPNTEGDGIHVAFGKVYSAKLFAWDCDSLAPICTTYELKI